MMTKSLFRSSPAAGAVIVLGGHGAVAPRSQSAREDQCSPFSTADVLHVLPIDARERCHGQVIARRSRR